MKQHKGIYITSALATIALSTLFLLLMIATQPSQAAGLWYVAPGGDDYNDCLSSGTPCATINAAVEKSAFINGDTVLVATGVYTGTGDEVVRLDEIDVTLSGGWDENFSMQNGISTIDGEGERTGIDISYEVEVIIARFQVQNCAGNGIRNRGTLTMNDSIVSGNSYIYEGGGFYNSGNLTLNNCIVSGNTASRGGGIFNIRFLELNISTVNDNNSYGNGGGIASEVGFLVLNNSTISNNSADGFGGGIFHDYVKSWAPAYINNSTISSNTANRGGGIYITHWPYESGSVTSMMTIKNTILAGNMDTQGSPDCYGGVGSEGYTLVGDISGCSLSTGPGDLINVDAMLFPLVGSPSYHPLLRSSPAIDAGDPAGCRDHLGNPLDTDQRGIARVGRCDIGSYEYDPDNDPLSYIYFPLLIR
jgi:hypothetical protein